MNWNASTSSITSAFNYKLFCKKLSRYKVVIIIYMFFYSSVQIEHESCGIKSLFSFFLANNIMVTIFILPGEFVCTAPSSHHMEIPKINKILFHLLSWKTKYMWKDYKMSCDVLIYPAPRSEIACKEKLSSVSFSYFIIIWNTEDVFKSQRRFTEGDTWKQIAVRSMQILLKPVTFLRNRPVSQ